MCKGSAHMAAHQDAHARMQTHKQTLHIVTQGEACVDK